MSFTDWYAENKESEILRDMYEQCLADMREIEPGYKQTFRQWAKKYYEEEINE